ncbi:tetratricopeptide repeat protein [Microvirga sp. HBU67558]|uniref:adenylate/guanylate cyclase domain-containing protein n=1 Tax=Microvirga TaxID=186650 RepID=UPI001B396AA9|nr:MULTISPECIES: adenylate/guanylate cyclase domain-containing protein [unclassified Microvirga]MBQ0819673.1 tetratricopeptide repeat protein [Microvirga sp. HBU67558]
MDRQEHKVERRLAAILAVDVVGASGLMEADEASTLSAIRTIFSEMIEPAAARHQGRIVKTMGDGALLEFASPVEAVLCAAETQTAIADHQHEYPDVQLRIGINLGDILIGDDGDILGDSVNVASRLESIADPGGICISGKVYDELQGKLDLSFEDRGEQNLKNIARPVRVYALCGTTPIRTLGPKFPFPNKPFIAVLPFMNLSGDPEQEYFADGITEDLIVALSRCRWLFVIARNSVFTLKGRAVDIKQVSRQLGVRYVLEGSVRKAGNRVRITAQLVEAVTGADIWAGRFDRDLMDIFALQDEITESVVSAIEPSLQAAEIERARAKVTNNLEAYDLYLRALPEFYAFTEQGFRRAETLLRQAVERDPGYAEAWGALADCRGRLMVGGWTEDWDAHAARSREAALQAVQCDPDNARVLAVAAWSLASLSGVLERAVTFCERALYLQPNSSYVLTNCGWVLIYTDECERALACLEKARRLNPLDPRGYITLNAIGAVHFMESRFEETEQFTRRALEMNPDHPISLRYLTAALAQMGRLAEAAEVGRVLQSTRWEAMRTHLNRTCYRNPEKRELLFDGLRGAGVQV